MAKNKHTYLRRDERLREILHTALGQYQNDRKSFTTATMARWQGLATSTKLKKMLDQLVDEGWFVREEKVHRNSLMKDGNRFIITKHVYSFAPKALNSMCIL